MQPKLIYLTQLRWWRRAGRRSWWGWPACVCAVMAAMLALGVPAPAWADPLPLWSDPVASPLPDDYGVGGRVAVFVDLASPLGFAVEVVNLNGTLDYQASIGNTEPSWV